MSIKNQSNGTFISISAATSKELAMQSNQQQSKLLYSNHHPLYLLLIFNDLFGSYKKDATHWELTKPLRFDLLIMFGK